MNLLIIVHEIANLFSPEGFVFTKGSQARSKAEENTTGPKLPGVHCLSKQGKLVCEIV